MDKFELMMKFLVSGHPRGRKVYICLSTIFIFRFSEEIDRVSTVVLAIPPKKTEKGLSKIYCS